jgi:hypothetical protein
MVTPVNTGLYVGGPLSSGSTSMSQATDGGFALVSQNAVVTSLASGAIASDSIKLPPYSQIVSIIAEKIVDWAVGEGDATQLNVYAGSSSGGTQYMPSTNMASVARTEGTLTVAQVLARGAVGGNTEVYFSVDPNGTVLTTQAQIRFTINYVQTQ